MAEATYKLLTDGSWGAWVKGRKVKPGSLIGIKALSGRIDERRVADVLNDNGIEGKERLMLVSLKPTGEQ